MTDQNTPTVSDVLTRAIEVLERDGWCQGTLHDQSGAHCALGALDAAARGMNADYWRTRLAVDRYMERNYRISGRDLAPTAEFNDDPMTTAEDVILSFKRIIAEQDGAA